MATAYATVEDYRTDTGDEASPDGRVASMLASQSAKLRATCGIREGQALTADQLLLCRELVCDACRKALVPPSLEGYDGSLVGASQASFTANGFSGQLTLANASGSAYFDRNTLSALMASLGRRQRMGTITPAIGGR